MTESKDGYVDAFYRIADLMGIPAQPLSPKEVFETQMLPRLHQTFGSPPIPAEPYAVRQTWTSPSLETTHER